MNFLKNIELLEEEDRYIASSFIKDLFTRNNFTETHCNPTDITCSVDLRCTTSKNDKTYYFNVEIKKNNKTDWLLILYPHALLKKDKLERMIKESKGKSLYYLILLNLLTAYLYDVGKIDWDNVELVNLRLKRTLFNPNSDWICVPTYRIPYRLGKLFNISLYYTEYKKSNHNEQTL